MQTCDICHEKLGFMNKFRYADGCICKQCYKKASRQYTETITDKSYAQIQALCSETCDIAEGFEVTGRIGNYLLVDERNRKICVLNNRMTKQQVSDPDFYNIEDIKTCEILCEPRISPEEMEKKMLQKEEGMVKALRVKLSFKDARKPAEIFFFEGTVRMKSFAFKQSFGFARRITEEVTRLQALCVE